LAKSFLKKNVYKLEKIVLKDMEISYNENEIVEIPENLEEIKIPYVVKDKILMSPGIWNGCFYSSDQIHNAFMRTDWEDKSNRSLFLDHEDMRSSEWVGEVVNIREDKEGNLLGDLVFVDKDTAVKIAYGAKMGISPKVRGKEDDGKIIDFMFENFSVVINPAVKTAYINNMQKIDTEESMMVEENKVVENAEEEQETQNEEVEEKKEEQAQAESSREETSSESAEGSESSSEEPAESSSESSSEPAPAAEASSESSEEAPAEMSSTEEDLVEQLSSILEKLKEKKLSEKKSEHLSAVAEEFGVDESDLLEAIKGLAKKKKKEYPYPEYKKVEEEIKTMKEELNKKDEVIRTMSQKLDFMEKKLNEPERETIKSASTQEMSSHHEEDADTAMLKYLYNMRYK
jgi:hypothetical protein